MSLVVPVSRANLLPLSGPEEIYDNPGTPETIYSFQDQPVPKAAMQSEPAQRLMGAALGSNVNISTDDEMLDSDIDQRGDEDFDIDVDAEVYSVTAGDLEVHMTMEEDYTGYTNVEAGDRDDVMLDDEPMEYNEEELFGVSQDNGEQTEVLAQPGKSPLNEATHDTATSFSIQHTEIQETYSNDAEPIDALDQTSKLDTDVSNSTEQTTATAVKQSADAASDNRGDIDTELQLLAHDDSILQPDAGRETDDVTETSTATLAQERVDNENRIPEDEGHIVEDHKSHADHDDGNSDEASYQYPVIVQYDHNQLTLFPSMADWSDEPALAAVYDDIPSDYLLPDVSVCGEPLANLFFHIRDVLGTSVGPEFELVIEIPLLGLKIGEDNTACKSVSLRRALDLHNQLHENDGYDVPLPVNMTLHTVPRFDSRLEEISLAVQERKGLQECLTLLHLPPVDCSNEIADIADENEVLQAGSVADNHAVEDAKEQREVLGQPELVHVEDQGNSHDDVNVLASVRGAPDGPATRNDSATVTGDNTTDEEELLEYEDGENSGARVQAASEQGQTSNQAHEVQYPADGVHLSSIEPELQDFSRAQRGDDGAESEKSGLVEQGSARPQSDTLEEPSTIPVFQPDENQDEEEYHEEQNYDEYSYGQDIQDPTQYVEPDETEVDTQATGGGFPVEDVSRQYVEPDETEVDIQATERGFPVEDVSGDGAEYVDDGTGENQYEDDGLQGDEHGDAGDYYAENRDEYIEQQVEYAVEEVQEVQDNEYEEYPDDSDYVVREFDVPQEDGPANDPTVTDAEDASTHSPALSTHEEELIDYDEEEERERSTPGLHKFTDVTSPSTHKRSREDIDQDGDGQSDENQALKRARAE